MSRVDCYHCNKKNCWLFSCEGNTAREGYRIGAGYEDLKWTKVVENKVLRWAFVVTVMNSNLMTGT